MSKSKKNVVYALEKMFFSQQVTFELTKLEIWYKWGEALEMGYLRKIWWERGRMGSSISEKSMVLG